MAYLLPAELPLRQLCVTFSGLFMGGNPVDLALDSAVILEPDREKGEMGAWKRHCIAPM